MSDAAATYIAFDTRPLHDLAHSAVVNRRDPDGWWGEPMETAMVAVGDAKHSAGSRHMAEDAYQ